MQLAVVSQTFQENRGLTDKKQGPEKLNFLQESYDIFFVILFIFSFNSFINLMASLLPTPFILLKILESSLKIESIIVSFVRFDIMLIAILPPTP